MNENDQKEIMLLLTAQQDGGILTTEQFSNTSHNVLNSQMPKIWWFRMKPKIQS